MIRKLLYYGPGDIKPGDLFVIGEDGELKRPTGLKEARFHSGLTQKELGLMTGSTQTQICLYEKRRTLPYKKTRDKIAAALGLHHNFLDWNF